MRYTTTTTTIVLLLVALASMLPLRAAETFSPDGRIALSVEVDERIFDLAFTDPDAANRVQTHDIAIETGTVSNIDGIDLPLAAGGGAAIRFEVR